MKVTTIELNGVKVSLRLTASKLAAYAAEIGSSGNTMLSVMDALDNMESRGKLLTAALTYKGNPNSVQDGFDLIDMMADADYDPVKVKELIVSLAVDSGIVGRDDAAKYNIAIKAGSEKLHDAAVAVLSGDMSNLPAGAKQDGEEPQENPT